MKQPHVITRLGVCLALGLALSACSWLPQKQPKTAVVQSASTSLVKIVSGGLLLSSDGQPELGLTLLNNSSRTLWISAHFKTPASQTDCTLGKEIEGQGTRLYVCPQAAVQADTDYPVEITIYSDIDQTQQLATLPANLRFTSAEVAALTKTRRS